MDYEIRQITKKWKAANCPKCNKTITGASKGAVIWNMQEHIKHKHKELKKK